MAKHLWTDQTFKSWGMLKELVEEENITQYKKYGIQKCSPFEWLGFLTAEVGELSQAIKELIFLKGEYNKIIVEAIQVATLALKIAEMAEYEQNN